MLIYTIPADIFHYDIPVKIKFIQAFLREVSYQKMVWYKAYGKQEVEYIICLYTDHAEAQI